MTCREEGTGPLHTTMMESSFWPPLVHSQCWKICDACLQTYFYTARCKIMWLMFDVVFVHNAWGCVSSQCCIKWGGTCLRMCSALVAGRCVSNQQRWIELCGACLRMCFGKVLEDVFLHNAGGCDSTQSWPNVFDTCLSNMCFVYFPCCWNLRFVQFLLMSPEVQCC